MLSKEYNEKKEEVLTYISKNRPTYVYVKVNSESTKPLYDSIIKKIGLTKQGLNWIENKTCFIGERKDVADYIEKNKNKKSISMFSDSNYRFVYLPASRYKITWAFNKEDLPRKKIYFAIIEQPKVYQGLLLPEEGASIRIEERLKKGRSFKIFSEEELIAANKYIEQLGGVLKYMYSSREISMMEALDMFDFWNPNKDTIKGESYD